MNRLVFITWSPYSTRSETLSQRLGAELIKIHYMDFKNPLHAPIKYTLQAISTLFVLFKKKPDICLVMNPPIFCALIVWIYCIITRRKFVLDSHTGAFLESKWKKLEFLHSFLAQKALVNILTNEYLSKFISKWGSEYYIIPDPPIEFPTLPTKQLKKSHITIVNTFSYDEPVKEILKAASKCPEVNFSLTGNLKHCKAEYFESKPANLEFTDFLPKEAYLSLLASSDAILVLTTENYTTQSGANEAMSLNIPIITSDWPILRSIFYKGTVFVDNSAEDILKGIREALDNHVKLKREIEELRQERLILSREIETDFRIKYLKTNGT